MTTSALLSGTWSRLFNRMIPTVIKNPAFIIFFKKVHFLGTCLLCVHIKCHSVGTDDLWYLRRHHVHILTMVICLHHGCPQTQSPLHLEKEKSWVEETSLFLSCYQLWNRQMWPTLHYLTNNNDLKYFHTSCGIGNHWVICQFSFMSRHTVCLLSYKLC